MVKVLSRDIIIYCMAAMLNYFFYVFFNSFGALDIFLYDYIPFITIIEFLAIFGLGSVAFFVWVVAKKKLSSIHIWLVKNRFIVYMAMFVMGIVCRKKAVQVQESILILFLEFMVVYVLYEYEVNKIFPYDYYNVDVGSIYAEKPVSGRENLTKPQIQALDQLIQVLDKRRREDSFNIALIGAWGCGKTSVTDTLISEMQKREGNEKKYFILKINIQTFSGTKNIVEYVNKYLCTLFKKYGIDGVGKPSNMVFLSSLSKMLKETDSMLALSDVLDRANNEFFSDIENERILFIEKIQKLLKEAGRKNIVFVIDDADRTEIKEEVLKLLSEFSSINGIISIILLDKKDDISLRPEEQQKDGQMQEYNAIDKYVHIRVRIGKSSNIEYEKNITSQIIIENNSIKKMRNCYMNCPVENNISLLSPIQEYQTTIIEAKNRYSTNNSANILTEIFMVNLQQNHKNLGKYFEEIVMEYIYNSKELMPFIKKMLITKPEKWDIELLRMSLSWTGGGFSDEKFDWIMRIQNNINQYFFILSNMIGALDVLADAQDEVKTSISTIEEIYDYYMFIKFPIPERTWENRKENPVEYIGLQEMIQLFLPGKEQENICCLLKEQKYEEIKVVIKEKMIEVGNFRIVVLMLADFIDYLRKVMNNYRTFKMQLREAELLDMNYLDYLINEWRPTAIVERQMEQLKTENLDLEDVHFNSTSLRAFINKILYTTYITYYGRRFMGEELKNRRLWIYEKKEEYYLIISKKEEDQYSNIVLDSTGKQLKGLSQITETQIYNETWKIFE